MHVHRDERAKREPRRPGQVALHQVCQAVEVGGAAVQESLCGRKAVGVCVI
jgi:hypothetical protein